MKIDKPNTALTEEEFETELERVRDSRSTMEPVTEDRASWTATGRVISFTAR